MKKSLPIIIFLAIVGIAFFSLSSFVKARIAYKQQAEAAAVSVYIYTDLQSDILEQVCPQFMAESHIKPVVVHVTNDQLIHGTQVGSHRPDIYISSQNNLNQMKEGGLLKPFYSAQTDAVLNIFKDPQGYWTGIWLDPIVFVVNDDFDLHHPAFHFTWTEVMTRNSVRLTMSDFTSSALSEDLLLSLAEQFGVDPTFQLLSEAQNHLVQYGKYLSTPSRMAAMGNADIAVSDFNEAEKTKKEGLPVKIYYPEDGSPWFLYGAALSSNGAHPDFGAAFINWMLDPRSYGSILKDHSYYFFLIQDIDAQKDDHGQSFAYWQQEKNYTIAGRNALLKQWIDQVRFGGK